MISKLQLSTCILFVFPDFIPKNPIKRLTILIVLKYLTAYTLKTSVIFQ